MRHQSPKMTNKKMNRDVYNTRSRVMQFIYEAKELVPNLPRLTFRITDLNDPRSSTLGMAKMGDLVIWIPERTVNKFDDNELALRHVVLHEIAHAVFSAEHDDNCLLMAPAIRRTTREQQNKAFLCQASKAATTNPAISPIQ